MMIPDTAPTYPELSDTVSKSSGIQQFVFSRLHEYLNIEGLEHWQQLIHSDDPLDEDLFRSCLDEDFYPDGLNDDQLLYTLHEDPCQEKVNAAVIEAAALKSHQVFISPELCRIVNPNEIFPNEVLKKNDGLKLKVTDDVVLNNALSGESGDEIGYKKKNYRVQNDHCYVKGGKKDEVAVKMEEVLEEDFAPQNVVVKVEAPVVKRPVGRPRKNPPVTKPVKRSAAHFDEETNEEFVDVESIDVKRPRKAPKAKPSPRAPPKKTPAQKRKVTKPSVSVDKGCSSHFQAIDPLNPHGYVMRQAKTSALKKIAKTKKSPTASCSKRSDHNDMERRRRHELRNLFEELKGRVPTELLVDDNNKIKKNPSKNTILVGSQNYIDIICEDKKTKYSFSKKNRKFQKKLRRLAKVVRKRCKKLLSRRFV